MVHYFPSEPDFHRANFGNCPLPIILEALDLIDELQDVNAAAIAEPVSRLLRTNIEWKDDAIEYLKYSNPAGYRLAIASAKEAIDPDIAQLYLDLLREGKIPAWASTTIDIYTIRLASQ